VPQGMGGEGAVDGAVSQNDGTLQDFAHRALRISALKKTGPWPTVVRTKRIENYFNRLSACGGFSVPSSSAA
jgi:hypothetical protein